MNWIAPTKTAAAPGSLAKALTVSGVGSLPTDCMLSAKALATGVSVSSAVAPWTVKAFSERLWPEGRSAVATRKVAD